MDPILQKLVEWARITPEISALILEGSRGAGAQQDEFSDYDINVFFRGENRFLTEDNWMNLFGKVLVYQKENFFVYDTFIQTRLVLYENSPRIDFSFWPANIMEEKIIKKLPESYKNGYQILIDKEGICNQLLSPSGDGFKLMDPSPREFLDAVYHFWFEALASVKYLQRGSLWFAKSILDGPVRRSLFQMILWKEGVEQGWDRNAVHLGGKNLEKEVMKSTLQKIPGCFSGYSLNATAGSLLHMTALFKILARDVSNALNYRLPEEKIVKYDKYLLQFITQS